MVPNCLLARVLAFKLECNRCVGAVAVAAHSNMAAASASLKELHHNYELENKASPPSIS